MSYKCHYVPNIPNIPNMSPFLPLARAERRARAERETGAERGPPPTAVKKQYPRSGKLGFYQKIVFEQGDTLVDTENIPIIRNN